MSDYRDLRITHKKKGNSIGKLLPANWISLNGNYSPSELREIANLVEKNFKKANGNKERHND